MAGRTAHPIGNGPIRLPLRHPSHAEHPIAIEFSVRDLSPDFFVCLGIDAGGMTERMAGQRDRVCEYPDQNPCKRCVHDMLFGAELIADRADRFTFVDERRGTPLCIGEATGVRSQLPFLLVATEDVLPPRMGNLSVGEDVVLREHAFDTREGFIDEWSLKPMGLTHLDGDRRDPIGCRDRP